MLNFVQPPSHENLMSILENASNAAYKAQAIADGAAKAFDEARMQLVAAKADLIARTQASSSSRACAKADLIAHRQADSSSREGSSFFERTLALLTSR